jgi:hypothetical protein
MASSREQGLAMSRFYVTAQPVGIPGQSGSEGCEAGGTLPRLEFALMLGTLTLRGQFARRSLGEDCRTLSVSQIHWFGHGGSLIVLRTR